MKSSNYFTPKKKRLILIALSLSLLCSCTVTDKLMDSNAGRLLKSRPAEVTLHIAASKEANLKKDGMAYPVQIQIFELLNTDTFLLADFFPLYLKAQETLGDDLVWHDELSISPGQAIKMDAHKLGAESRYIAVVAGFGEWENAQWRALIEVPANKKKRLNINILSNAVEINNKNSLYKKIEKATEIKNAKKAINACC